MAALPYIRGVTETTTAAKPDAAAVLSPGRSALSIFAGFVVLNILGFLFSVMASTLWPALFPTGEGAQPTTAGLELWLVGELVNALAAGLLAARLAGRAPVAHAAVLAALNGFFAMTAMGELRAMPTWFALGFALTAPVGILAGGLVVAWRARTKL